MASEPSEKVKAALKTVQKAPVPSVAIQLPVFRENQPEILPTAAAWMVIGRPKGGKSKFIEHVSRSRVALGQDPILHLDTENGCHQLAGAIQPIRNLAELERVIALIEDESALYSGYALDTGDMLNEWCEARACQDLNIKAMGQGSYGADWAKARGYFMEYFLRLKALHKDLWVVCHTKTDKSSETSQLRPNLPAGLAEALMGQCDSIAYISTEKIKGVTSKGERIPEHYERYISFAGHEGLCAGSRFSSLDGRKFSLADLKVTPEANLFGRIIDAFANNTQKETSE